MQIHYVAGLTRGERRVVMAFVSESMEEQSTLSVSAALCVDREAFDRFGRVLRNLLVGLVDQAVSVRLLGCDPRVDTLTLGPVQTLVHKRLTWPVAGRRIEELLGALSAQPPRIVHAMSRMSYGVANAVAEAFDADLVLQATSLADCDAIAQRSGQRVGRILAFTQPLRTVLEEQVKTASDLVELVRPGVLASQHIACFANPDRTATLLCLSPLERGSGVDRLIEAVAILKKRDHDVMLFVLGQGRREHALRREIHERRLSACVTLARPAGDLSQAMHSADIFVQPRTDTAFTENSLQAMGAGMAVVTCPTPVFDFFRHGETAVVCDKPKAQSLAAAIEQLLTDRAFAQRIATAAMKYVREHHAMSRMAEGTANAYRKLALARATFSLKR